MAHETPPAKPVETPSSLPKSSLASNAVKASWKIVRNKNPITGEEVVFVEQRSKKPMYNKYHSEGLSKVELSINCTRGVMPSLALSLDGVLQSDLADHFQGDAKVDQRTFVIDWYVKDGTMVSEAPEDVVQRLQTGSTFMMSYRFYGGGVEYPEFDLSGLRTTMMRAGCKKLTE